MLLENPIVRRMILESLRKVLEPLVVASNLTWLVFRSAFDMITDPAQIEECVKDPHAFFAYMLKKVCELPIGNWPYPWPTSFCTCLWCRTSHSKV